MGKGYRSIADDLFNSAPIRDMLRKQGGARIVFFPVIEGSKNSEARIGVFSDIEQNTLEAPYFPIRCSEYTNENRIIECIANVLEQKVAFRNTINSVALLEGFSVNGPTVARGEKADSIICVVFLGEDSEVDNSNFQTPAELATKLLDKRRGTEDSEYTEVRKFISKAPQCFKSEILWEKDYSQKGQPKAKS